jgi:hypothetical protein
MDQSIVDRFSLGVGWEDSTIGIYTKVDKSPMNNRGTGGLDEGLLHDHDFRGGQEDTPSPFGAQRQDYFLCVGVENWTP